MESNRCNLMLIAEICREHNISKYSVYTLIKNDPTFPCVNIGPKKNYRIPSDQFKTWLEQRIKERHYYDFKVPTGDQLFNIGRHS